MRRMVLTSTLLAFACATSPIKEIPLSGSDRDLPQLFLGGWDGHRLLLYDDTTLEPGRSLYRDVVQALHGLSSDLYAVAYLDQGEVKTYAAQHGIFCSAAACLVVLARHGGEKIDDWGKAEAVIELNGMGTEPIGSVWIQEKAIRAPGPKKWPLLCRARNDQPRYVHEDGGALFPGQTVGGLSFAVFGPQEVATQYQQANMRAPSDTTCDEDIARSQREPQPERPQLKADPNLIQKLK